MPSLKSLTRLYKTLTQLGLRQSGYFLCYQLGLRSGYLRLRTPATPLRPSLDTSALQPDWFLDLPNVRNLRQTAGGQLDTILLEADEIALGKMRYFGGKLKALNLAPVSDPQHWTQYERGRARVETEDIKDVWEPARFNWAVTLAEAFYLSKDERYAAVFWTNFETFRQANPVNCGPNWSSAQEVSLRMLALILSAHMLFGAEASSKERLAALCQSVAEHARRIPPTINYAKAQNNNHLLSEAVGLFAAASFLPNHPDSAEWREKGLRWFNQGILAQVDPDGTYAQHSSNYHRLMLVLALWMQRFLDKGHQNLDDAVLVRLAAATEWLSVRLDPLSGRVPNLGHNDGSNILPLSSADFDDYRPVVQAASRAFRGLPALPSGPWDDLCLWLDIPLPSGNNLSPASGARLDHLILGDSQDWASLRAVRFHSRPAHADQLHVDIWHKGLNVALDPGTFRYNAPPPWENALTGTAVHNTLTVDGHDQMTRAGKFLWLDWAQARVDERSPQELRASQDGYRRLGLRHQRSLRRGEVDGWVIDDELLPLRELDQTFTIGLHWLLPDWPFVIEKDGLTLSGPQGMLILRLSTPGQSSYGRLNVVKAGQSLTNGSDDLHLGWYSPTYGEKVPALSIQFQIIQKPPIKIRSVFLWADEPG
ncbi:MAG: hypothetical protein PWQ55_2147 [Chloroflexota bacterium]|nr:hypothetical protein [Chloroflexota bacterium]